MELNNRPSCTGLDRLRWHRVRFTLRNVRHSRAVREHPLSIINGILEGVAASLPPAADPAPFVFHLPQKRHTFTFREHDIIPVELLLFRRDEASALLWAQALERYLADSHTGRNFQLAAMEPPEERTFAALVSEMGEFPKEGELCLDFLTPLPFRRRRNKDRLFLAADEIIRLTEERIERLFGTRITYQPGEDGFTLLPYYWHYTEIRHHSKSQPGRMQFVNGCAGPLYLKGRFANFLPYLILGREIHAGAKDKNAQGYYRLPAEPVSFFARHFPRHDALAAVVRDTLERYDSALESLAGEGHFPFDEERFCHDLCEELQSGQYTPSAYKTFMVKKGEGELRRVEQAGFKDLIVQQYILSTCGKIFDRMFEESSIGFRKGMSRQKAVTMIRDAVADGYRFVIESDIEDFFPSVNLEKLEAALAAHLPAADASFLDLLRRVLHAPYVLDGEVRERRRGLAQGSPLSPLLANLYLDSFDEFIHALPVKMIRYADDFIILAKDRPTAEAVLEDAEEHLAGLDLRVNRGKTAIKEISEGVEFLGYRFDGAAADAEEGPPRLMKKPLYITEPYLFLSLNGDAVDIKRNGAMVDTVPLRRVSEILVMEKCSFSTAFIAKCVAWGIPVTTTLGTGYFVTTIKPDSKQYHDVALAHGTKFHALSDAERLCLAREFAAGKVANYIPLFRQHYGDATAPLIRDLEEIASGMDTAGTVDELRGHEGLAAKKVYAGLNGLINDPTFHMRKRDRKSPDRLNTLLNFGYYLLFSRINASIRCLGLNPYLGFLHSHMDDYESLVCDVEELFRARIDRMVVRLVNLKSIGKDDFTEEKERLRLSRDAIKTFIGNYEMEMNRKAGWNELTLKESIYVQCLLVKRWACEDKTISFYRWQA